jgi:hypothetical protein
MSGLLPFHAFATAVRDHLWVLEIEPAFQMTEKVMRFMWPPYVAELEQLDEGLVRVALSSHGQLVRTIGYVTDVASAKLVADGIIAIFQPDAVG